MRRFFVCFHTNSKVGLSSQYKEADYEEASISLASIPIGNEISLPDSVYHHWGRVLRAKVGQQSVLFDGLGGETLVELVLIDKKQAIVQLISHIDIDRSARHFSTIAIVMSRGDRMDYAIQKATELGATAIQLLTSQHGEVRLKTQQIDKKLTHWQQVALSACEQCGLNRPPLILSPLSIDLWLRGDTGHTTSDILYLSQDEFYQKYLSIPPLKLVLAVPDVTNNDSINAIQSINTYCDSKADNETRFDILIGAEGGLSTSEYQLARQQDFIPWQIGNRTLRTETAPVVALSIINLSGI